TMVYEASLKLMALAELNDGDVDRDAITALAKFLQDAQLKKGENPGSWSYSPQGLDLGGDRSNAQFAVAALAAARRRGVPVPPETLKSARLHFDKQQSPDGGWSYQAIGGSTGSMTAAGIASTCLLESAIPIGPERGDDAQPACCLKSPANASLMRAHDWLTNRFSVRHNPRSQSWLLYYLRELEIASSAHGVRFYGSRDWYRDGTEFLLAGQSQRDGSWRGDGLLENDPIVGTCFALLFLTRGNAPVLFFKLDYEADAAKYGAPRELGVLTDHISGSAGWPRHVVWQRLGLNDCRHGDESVVHEAPILFLRGEKAPEFRDEDLELLKTYVERGGTIFAQPACGSKDFDQGFRALVAKLYPDGQLARLKADHPVFSSESKLDADAVELHGLEVGGKTRIIYAPQDLACLWSRADEIAPARTDEMRKQIEQALQIGINAATYATGKKLHGKIWSKPAAAQ
ncbi:MAG TPA: DUF4159 domain-containing protein, partial [Planctomycetaceae bacterium]|nr:DUF4159 domain-containing protein [Planctomycetaceae bacterium]